MAIPERIWAETEAGSAPGSGLLGWPGLSPAPSLTLQRERRGLKGPHHPAAAGPGAFPRGLRGHPASLRDRLHPLGQPLRGCSGRRAPAPEGEQGGRLAAHHRRGRWHRLQKASPVSGFWRASWGGSEWVNVAGHSWVASWLGTPFEVQREGILLKEQAKFLPFLPFPLSPSALDFVIPWLNY